MIDTEYIGASCELVELQKIRNFIEKKALEYGLSEKSAGQVALAVDEACTNLIEHAFHHDKNREICISTEKSGDKMIVSIFDDSSPFNPLDVEKPNMDIYFKELKRGGLGIHLMRSVMDEIEYYPSKQNGSQNVLKLIKKIN
ncbi:MAG: ATP-binding protein [bacterium]